MIVLTDVEIQQFQSMREQARIDAADGTTSYWRIYRLLADLLVEKYAVPLSDPTVRWLLGAAEANAGRGAFSELIRNYTEMQYQLRYGISVPSEKMQEASNAVAENLLRDLLGENGESDGWPKGHVPDINRIAEVDATAVGEVLFGPENGKDEGDTAFDTNAAWSGALLFTLLDSNQTGRLTSTGVGGRIDTLNDVRDAFYAVLSFCSGLRAAASNMMTGSVAQTAVDAEILGRTMISFITDAAWRPGIDLPQAVYDFATGFYSNAGSLSAMFRVVGELGPNTFLDMLMGAAQGESLIGSTDDASFAEQARAFFDGYGTALRDTATFWLPDEAGTLAAQARSDVHTRAALAALSIIGVEVDAAVAGRFDLYDPATGQGSITAQWIDDRAAFAVHLRRKLDGPGGIVNGQENLRFFDAAADVEVLVGAGSAHRRQFVFGGDGADVVTGQGFADHLYGGAGNDTLLGLGGDDYLQGDDGADVLDGGAGNDVLVGGAGSDVYRFTGDWGVDTIIDSDGLGRIEVDGVTLTGGVRLGENVWQSEDGQWDYLVNSGGDLVISGKGRPGRIIVQGWRREGALTGGLGIVLPAEVPPSVPVHDETLVLQGDQVRGREAWALLPDGTFSPGEVDPGRDDILHQLNDDGYRNYGLTFDFIVGKSRGEFGWTFEHREFSRLHYSGLAGNDVVAGTSNDDYIDGGDGDDVIFGGFGSDRIFGGAGRDVIASNLFAYHYAVAPDSLAPGAWMWTSGASPVADSSEVNRWHTEISADGYLDAVDFYAMTPENTRGQLPPEDPNEGDVVDAGDGDDWVWGGLGGDWIFGGAGNDSLSGLGGGDILDGGDGDDRLAGDSREHAALVIATRIGGGTVSYEAYPFDAQGASAALRGGNDLIDGGAGNDVAWGDGGDDLIWGGDGDDILFGDADASIVPGEFHGNDRLDGGEGHDVLVGNGGHDVLYGGPGDDLLQGDADDLPAGFHGDDELYGGEGNDRLYGDGGNDTLIGGPGRDAMFGGDGNDLFVSDGLDYMDGGAGDDIYEIFLPEEAGVAPQIVDREGVNTIRIRSAAVDWAQVRVVTHEGLTYMVWGDKGAVAFGDGFDASVFEVQNARGETRSLQSIVDATSLNGKIPSASWHGASGWAPTTTIPGAQMIEGTNGDEALAGGPGNDLLLARGGDDLLEGGDGADTLYGGAGADVLRGGAGNDVLFGGEAPAGEDWGEDHEDDGAVDVYLFERGDGADFILASATIPDAPLDVIRFGHGISAPDLNIRNLYEGTSMSGTLIVIDYGQGDRITLSPGAEKSIKELQFADGTAVTLASLISVPVPSGWPSLDGTIRGTEADDLLMGTERDERIEGLRGDDTLDGGSGDDELIGGPGRNVYRFTLHSGSDVIHPTAGEIGVLVFDGPVHAIIQDEDLLLSMGGTSLVRVKGYTRDAAIAADWQVSVGDGEFRSLDTLLHPDGDEPTDGLAQRKQAFLDTQFWQMRTRAQVYTDEHTAPTADVVKHESLHVVQGEELSVAPFLTEELARIETVTETGVRPIYKTIRSSRRLRGWEARLTEARSGYAVEIPEGAFFIAHDTMLVPIHDRTPPTDVTRIVGYEEYSETYEWQIFQLEAAQTTIVGTSSSDTILAEHWRLGPTAKHDFVTTGTWRGALEAGDGDDVLMLMVDEDVVPYAGALRLHDWRPLQQDTTLDPFLHVDELPRGLGAWIDMGSGDDRATGTDGDDFIIGGPGSDWLDGWAGADTYYIDTAGDDVDRISDMAKSDGMRAMPEWEEAHEWSLRFPGFQRQLKAAAVNEDVVEFAPSILLGSLSYRWSEPYAADFEPRYEGDPGTTLRLLELYKDGRKFLEIEYEAETRTYDHAVSLPGIERFRFADGLELSLQEFLSSLDELPDEPTGNHPPVPGHALEGQFLTTGVYWHYVVPDDAFTDPDPDDDMTFSAQLANGEPLPSWLHFDPNTRTFRGTPPQSHSGPLLLRIRAADDAGANASQVLVLGIRPPTEPGSAHGGGNRSDLIIGRAGDDHITGGDDTDFLLGGAGNDWIDGGPGRDFMFGGPGDDHFIVDNPGDFVWDTEGNDTVWASCSYTLDPTPDNLVLTGTLDLHGKGNNRNNTLIGNVGDNLLDGAGGDDILIGGAGNDTYIMQRGYGSDTIVEDDATPGNLDVVQFGPGIVADDLWFMQSGDDLEIRIIGTNDRLTISDWYLGEQHRVEEFRMSDGAILIEKQVQNLVQAMAGFAPPPPGQVTHPLPYRGTLDIVMAIDAR